jgi:hypothetical protein
MASLRSSVVIIHSFSFAFPILFLHFLCFILISQAQVPVYSNMFSESRNYPRAEYQYRPPKNLPPMPQFQQLSSTQAPSKSEMVGTQRVKFFKRPMVPYLNTVPPEVIFAPAPSTSQGHHQTAQPVEGPPPLSKTVEIQTDYRESETQTNPYTPDYIINPNAPEPEVLSIANMGFGKGLPASLADVEEIDRLRAKRAFEASLPPLTDAASFEIRKQMMEAHELQEFEHREKAIAQMQEERLELLRAALNERDERAHQVADVRIEQLRQRRLQERDRALDEIQKRRIKTLRVLAKKRMHLDPESTKRDIVTEYANFGSEVYAPVARLGSVPMPEVRHVDVPQLDTMPGLQQLQSTLPLSATEAPIKAPVVMSATFGSRKGQQIALDIERLDAIIQSQKGTTAHAHTVAAPVAVAPSATMAATASPVDPVAPAVSAAAAENPMNMYKKLEAMVRPQTPSVEESHDDQEAAMVMLQRLLRGRAQQNLMCDGMEQRRALIVELRSVEQYPEALPAPHRFAADPERLATATVDVLQGLLMSSQFDMISKELHRITEERAIEHTAQVAETTRRMREAVESGRRQADSVRRTVAQRDFALHAEVVEQSTSAFLDETVAVALEQAAAEFAQESLQDEFHAAEEPEESVAEVDSSAPKSARVPKLNIVSEVLSLCTLLPPILSFKRLISGIRHLPRLWLPISCPTCCCQRSSVKCRVANVRFSRFAIMFFMFSFEVLFWLFCSDALEDRRFVDAAHEAIKDAVQQAVQQDA